MGNILLFIQHTSGKLPKASLAALSVALELKGKWGKGDIVGVALGGGSRSAAEEILHFGISKVYFSEDSRFEKYIAPVYAQALKKSFEDCGADTVVAAATSTGKDLAPFLAGLLDAAQASDIVAINADGSLRRPMYAGNVFADVALEGAKKIVTVRSTAFAPAPRGSKNGSVVELSGIPEPAQKGEVVAYALASGSRPELGDAAIVVSGGRAMASSENFQKYIYPLADALGAAVGASRAAVDSGYAPNDWQVGQTGKVVAPQLYIAVGISGAIQHLAGMKDSKVIAAINKDSEAPIFEIADYGLVADLFDAVPKLTEAVQKGKG